VSISDDGHIAALSRYQDVVSHNTSPLTAIEHLPGTALLPGFVNVHSHVFQRALRGHTHRPFSAQDTFWTWRHAMYASAQQLDPEQLYNMALPTYREMLKAGYTSVGEFHYIHHQPGGRPYADPNAMSKAVLQAANDAGIRIVLLMAAYMQGGFNQPLEAVQQRFHDTTIDAYLERIEMLRQAGFTVGLAPHSVRAVAEEWFVPIVNYSRTHQLPLHVHADEQMAEVTQCLHEHGCTPIVLLDRYGALSPLTTVVHATHANTNEIALLAERGCSVCVCPTTEGDLGDGIAPYSELVARTIPLCIGSDSNTRLDPVEELRWAEYSARMRYQRRRVLVSGNLASPGPLLLDYGTRHGAASLGLKTGTLAPGMPADFVTIDLNHPMLAGWSEDDLIDVLFFGASSEVIAQTWIQGKLISKNI
jgi:formimidoylglutamate deiminase